MIDKTQNDILKHDHSFSTQFVKTGERPQNFIQCVEPDKRFNKYPRAAVLMSEKNAWIKKRNHPVVYIAADLETYDLSSLGKFDVIYCDPPWEEYEKRAKRLKIYDQKAKSYKSWPLEQLKKLKIGELADVPSFIFLWAGSQHLEDARELLKEWGFKRCEDIVWVKRNKNRKSCPPQSEEGLFVRVKQHCLMGYKGDSRKAFDHNFIHPNIDIDVIVDEEPEPGSLEKPSEIYDIIERFCLGRKRIELFGRRNNIRMGWLVMGNELEQTKFNIAEYNKWFAPVDETPNSFEGGRLTGTTPAIENLRPKEDPQQLATQSQTFLHSQPSQASLPSQGLIRSQRSLYDEDVKNSVGKAAQN